MNFIKIPTKGMRDFSPSAMAIREYVLNIMKDTYENFGFQLISTPCVEHIENLTNKQGGDNEKLIFKILKRGEKLNIETSNPEDLVDSGLRYDLTVPLTRFYANNMNELNNPFRAFQIGNVWRADRPQRGRFREFMQCDLDMFGEKSNLAEIELITAVITFLKRLSFKNFQIKINDRRILSAMVDFCGFASENLDNILISLDKLDKIGFDGVKKELIENGYEETRVEKYLDLFNNELSLSDFCEQFVMEKNIVENLQTIISTVAETTEAQLIFDPTLVRGMSYYTGPIFEISVEDLGSSIGGGGRYDTMVEKYAGVSVPACGFSIGFERLILLLTERGFQLPSNKNKIALIIKEPKDLQKAMQEAKKLRDQNTIVKVVYRHKNFKHQLEMLTNDGYSYQEW